MRASAKLEFGGVLHPDYVSIIANAADIEGARLAWNSETPSMEQIKQAMADTIAAGEPMVFVKEDALGGRLWGLENALDELGLPWRATTEGDNETADSEAGVEFKPGHGDNAVNPGDALPPLRSLASLPTP